MKMIRAIVRPERERSVIDELDQMNLGAMTKVEVFGQGKQKTKTEAPIEWDDPLTKHVEVPKIMLMMVVEDGDVKKVTETIMKAARTDNAGDGKIFVTSVDQSYTVRTGSVGL